MSIWVTSSSAASTPHRCSLRLFTTWAIHYGLWTSFVCAPCSCCTPKGGWQAKCEHILALIYVCHHHSDVMCFDLTNHRNGRAALSRLPPNRCADRCARKLGGWFADTSARAANNKANNNNDRKNHRPVAHSVTMRRRDVAAATVQFAIMRRTERRRVHVHLPPHHTPPHRRSPLLCGKCSPAVRAPMYSARALAYDTLLYDGAA